MTELADYAWLIGPEAAAVLAELAEDQSPPHRQLARLRKLFSGAQARLAVDQANLRRKAIPKFGQLAGRLFFTSLALQQATDRWIARYKAERFPVARPIVDLCAGIGGDLMALAQRGPALGCERAPELALFAEANLRACGCPGKVQVGDAAEHHPTAEVRWHLDPDRRLDGRRSTQLEWHSPGIEFVEDWRKHAPHGALKLAPATKVPAVWQERAELEWISRRRECRQLVVWFGELAQANGKRRATTVTTASDEDDFPNICSFAGTPDTAAATTSAVAEYIYDTDPSIRAAGLTGAIAAALDLSALGPGASYLTSDRLVEHPMVRGFRVTDVLPLREQQLAGYFRQRRIGHLEIKKRGVETQPELLRKRLKLKGDGAATLVLARMGEREIAVVAKRCTNDSGVGLSHS